ncbi:MAG: TRAP transporter small permease subunit [Gammaproteobacteria bacterium]
MTALTVTIVLLRYVFQISQPVLQETLIYVHSLGIAALSGYTLYRDEHVRIDFLYVRFTDRQRAWVNLIGTFVFFMPFCAVMVWFSYDYVAQSWAVREISADSQGLPFVYVQKALLLLLPALLAAQGVALALKSVECLLAESDPR